MKNVPQRRLDAIAEEVFGLLGIGDIFQFLDGDAVPDNRMELRLQELIGTRQSYEVIELAMYLRACLSRSESLPSWQPLLNAAIELGQQRGEPVWDIFYGLVPHRADPERNTGQPVYKPHQT